MRVVLRVEPETLSYMLEIPMAFAVDPKPIRYDEITGSVLIEADVDSDLLPNKDCDTYDLVYAMGNGGAPYLNLLSPVGSTPRSEV